MTRPDEYREYATVDVSRDDRGILLVRLHRDNGPLTFGMDAHAEWVQLWEDISSDPHVRLVILTGTGDAFMPPREMPAGTNRAGLMTAEYWQRIMRESTDHVLKMLTVPVPMIAAVNGPMRIHTELALLCDIVLATPDTTLQDLTHFPEQAIPTDVQHVVMPALVGRLRSNYYFHTNELMTADEAHRLGLLNELVARENLLPRAYAIAEKMLRQPAANLRYYRRIMTHKLRREMHDMLELGLAFEGLAIFSCDWAEWEVEHEQLPLSALAVVPGVDDKAVAWSDGAHE
jgi:enoyl-CoA hydratase/carnithine racemase